MLRKKPAQYNRRDGTGIGADAGSGEWAGEKRRKRLDPSLHTEVHTNSSSETPPAEGYAEEAADLDLDLEKVTIPFAEVKRIRDLMIDKPYIFVDKSCKLDDYSQRRVYKRLVLYRLKADKLSKGESLETLRKELPDLEGKDIAQLHHDVDTYFKCLEGRGSLVWYFDPEFSKLQDLGNYQRLVLKNHDDAEYLDWEAYRTTFTTYKMDEEYVLFFTLMSQKLQWLKKYIGTKGSMEWATKTEIRGAHQALKIAEKFPGMTINLAYTAYGEHIWSLHYDYLYREGWDIIFFKVWKIITKEKMEFRRALIIVMEMDLFPQHDVSVIRFLTNRMLFDVESKFDSCVQDIPACAGDKDAMEKIKKAVLEGPKKKMLHEYMKKKMLIAREIGLEKDPSGPRMLPWDGPKVNSLESGHQ